MRLLFVNRDFQSGQTTHVDTLAAALHNKDTPVAIARFGALTEPMPAARQAGIPQLRFADPTGFRRVVQRFEPDVIHAHSSSAWPLVAAIARAQDIPLVLTAHGPGVDLSQNRAALQQAQAIIVPGPATASAISVPTVCIANGVDLRRFKPDERVRTDPPVIAYIGRVDRSRYPGFEAFCHATRQLHARVWFLGTGARKFPSHVRNLGWQPRVEHHLKQVSIACAVGRSLREAQACGAMGLVLGQQYHGPVLPTDWMHAPTDIWYGDAYPAVPTHRMVVQLRGDLATLLSDPFRLRQLQAQSRTLMERVSNLDEKSERHVRLIGPCAKEESYPRQRFARRLSLARVGIHSWRIEDIGPFDWTASASP